VPRNALHHRAASAAEAGMTAVVSQVPAAASVPLLETPSRRYATTTSACGQAGCHQLILPGQLIVRPALCRTWRHAACEYPRHIRSLPQAQGDPA
jgi:hypothetical protein